MRFDRHPRLLRVMFLLAVFQMFAPSVAAIADAWRMDQREPYAHLESETQSTCVIVHAHDCALCSIATGPTGTAALTPAPAAICRVVAPRVSLPVHARFAWARRASAPRAPPSLLS